MYLFKINNNNRKNLCKICPILTTKSPGQICQTKFLQMCSFSINLTSLHSLNLSFPLLVYVISTAILKFHLHSLYVHTDSPHFWHFHHRSHLSCLILEFLCYYCITLGNELLFTSSMTSSVLLSKIINLILPQVKSL